VALGDMRGFRSKIMGSVGGSQTFDRFWTSVFAQHTNGLDFAQTSGGDSLVIADRSPIRLIRSIKSLATSLRKSGYNLQMRVGAHSGHWRLNLDEDGGAHPEMSDIVGIAARLEPLGKAGAMIFTDKFLDDARRMGSSIDTEIFRPLRKDDTSNPEAFDDDKGLLISKKKEPEQWFSCFIIENIDDPNDGATSRLL
jgi:class 3 adenylate cyclase